MLPYAHISDFLSHAETNLGICLAYLLPRALEIQMLSDVNILCIPVYKKICSGIQ
jgi:hypothetical protein